MVDVGSIGGIPDPRRAADLGRSDSDRQRPAVDGLEGTAAGDGLAISPEARRAAEALRFAEFARAEPDVRPDRVEAARERLERGDLDEPVVLRRVIERILDDLT